jgi:oligopeptide/dipeptide ABC transporter ATP-binding protein
MVPGIFSLPHGCRFRPRCAQAMDRCEACPPLFAVGEGHSARCWLYEGAPLAEPVHATCAVNA